MAQWIKQFHLHAMSRMSDIFHQEAFSKIIEEGSKLRTYAKVKTGKGFEDYLSLIKHIETRTALTKIRLSNHDLMIETGRHQGIILNQRTFSLCNSNDIEDEAHLLLLCSTYSALRRELFNAVELNIPSFSLLSKEDQMKILLSDVTVLTDSGKFLWRALEI